MATSHTLFITWSYGISALIMAALFIRAYICYRTSARILKAYETAQRFPENHTP
jgi:hypothetical protein